MPQLNNIAVLGIDGGATSTKAVLLRNTGKECWRGSASACNATLLTQKQIFDVLKKIQADFKRECKHQKVDVVALCLAGMIDGKTKHKVELVARKIWRDIPIFISHDLMSGLYGGLGHGRGVVVISGTGASVFAKTSTQSIKVGGWGHVLGDSGSGYHIAHMGLRQVIAEYDLTGKVGPLGVRMLRIAQAHSLEQLTSYISVAEKREIAELSNAVFESAQKGHRPSKEIIKQAAEALARNVFAVFKRLKVKQLPICVTGGVFANQSYYYKIFKSEIKKVLPLVKVNYPQKDGAIGAALWGLEELRGRAAAEQAMPISVEEQKTTLDLSQITTEDANPRSKSLSHLTTEEAVELFLKEDEVIIPALREEQRSIAAAIDSIAQAFTQGGRLFYFGAGTSGRLGILDASECPPTFSVEPDMVQAVIAGGNEAVYRAVEGAEDDFSGGMMAVSHRGVTPKDVVCGIAASGRTPFVLGALKGASEVGAKTILLSCNPKLRGKLSVDVTHAIFLATGPETLTGSTRLRAGTATKMVLNMFTTLAMVKIGKVYDNFMIDVDASNEKLRARALRLVMILSGVDATTAQKILESNSWKVREALNKIKGSELR